MDILFLSHTMLDKSTNRWSKCLRDTWPVRFDSAPDAFALREPQRPAKVTHRPAIRLNFGGTAARIIRSRLMRKFPIFIFSGWVCLFGVLSPPVFAQTLPPTSQQLQQQSDQTIQS